MRLEAGYTAKPVHGIDVMRRKPDNEQQDQRMRDWISAGSNFALSESGCSIYWIVFEGSMSRWVLIWGTSRTAIGEPLKLTETICNAPTAQGDADVW